MNKSIARKTTLHDADDALCPDLTPAERLAVLAELNRIGLAALGLADTPLRRSEARKFSFRDFVLRPAILPA